MDMDVAQEGRAQGNGLVIKNHHQLQIDISPTIISCEKSTGSNGTSYPYRSISNPLSVFNECVRHADFCSGSQPLSNDNAIIAAIIPVGAAAAAIFAAVTMTGCDEEYSRWVLDSRPNSQAHLGRGMLLPLLLVSTDGGSGINSDLRHWKRFLIKMKPRHIIASEKIITAKAAYHPPTRANHGRGTQAPSSQFDNNSNVTCRLFKHGTRIIVTEPCFTISSTIL